MKVIPRSRADEEDIDNFTDYLNANKDLWIGIVKVVSFLVIFVAGVILGLAASAHVTRYVTSSHTGLFYSSHNFPVPSHKKNCFTLSNCKEDDFLGMKGFVNPTYLTHSMTDDELFWRASMVPKKDAYPYNRVPKVAFMFLTRGPLPFMPLWEKFFRGHEELFSIYVHTLPGYESNVTNTSVFYGRQIPNQDVQWGSITMLDGERRLLANALLDFSNERFVLLSESCIPIYDFKTVYKYLIGSSHSFVESYDEPTRYGRGRYSGRMYPNIKLTQWRKGSQWFEMNRALAVEIISDNEYYSVFGKYCKPTCYPDEHYLPTYINMFHGQMNANRTVTWVDWSIRSPHPATFGRHDITEGFIQSLRNNGTACSYNSKRTYVCHLFARKFSPDALEPLLNISSTVMKF
ncbi:glycosyltransferase BC10-like [Telopea speciosissima]|uniref:glycosyltransferase BC10-like n=1 Tax=Telopea speciosissima TaxID=54955 RepID=UPI001CC6044B|nr:glycosyltransferase BC10-like [Telopea speciosissima]